MTVAMALGSPVAALTPESPEVKALVAKGVKRLMQPGEDNRLGAKCLVGIALIKAGEGDHPRVDEALEAVAKASSKVAEEDVYSHGLAMIFLCEADRNPDRELLRKYLSAMYARQKGHGGWGYTGQLTGDTSQTQYMALAMWEAHNRGVSVESSAAAGMVKWLLATQGPAGEWGYQGRVGTPNERVKQNRVSPTMGAAAMASLMIGADLFGRLDSQADADIGVARADLPAGVRREADLKPASGPRRLSGSGVDWDNARAALSDGDAWMADNYKIEAQAYQCYFLYALERYQSFREFRDGLIDPSPKWYDQGYQYLLGAQSAPGEWDRQCGAESDTAFAVLFLLRSTQKSLRRRIGEGALVSGRGLPKRLAGARLSRGRVVAEVDEVEIADFLSLVSEGEADRLDALADNPAALLVASGDLAEDDSRRLQQLLRGGEPEARLIAARALGAGGRLDRAPDLLYALTDPDPRVVRAARDGLRRISRRPRGFGLPDEFDDDARWAAVESWKRWYLGVRPGAVLELP